MSRQYNITPYKAKKILVDNNIQLRTRAQQNAITNQKRGKSVNHEYFSKIETLNQAWLLGFLMADGYIAANDNGIGLELSSIDREILERIRDEKKFNGIEELKSQLQKDTNYVCKKYICKREKVMIQ